MYDDLEPPTDASTSKEADVIDAWPDFPPSANSNLLGGNAEGMKNKRKSKGKVKKVSAISTAFKPRHLSTGSGSVQKIKKQLPAKHVASAPALLDQSHSSEVLKAKLQHFRSEFISNLTLDDNLFATSFGGDSSTSTAALEYDPAIPNEEDSYHTSYEMCGLSDGYELQELDYRTLSRTIQISQVDRPSLEALVPELPAGDIIGERVSPSTGLFLTYGNQSDCVSAYHSLAVGAAREFCFKKYSQLPYVEFTEN